MLFQSRYTQSGAVVIKNFQFGQNKSLLLPLTLFFFGGIGAIFCRIDEAEFFSAPCRGNTPVKACRTLSRVEKDQH